MSAGPPLKDQLIQLLRDRSLRTGQFTLASGKAALPNKTRMG